MCANMSVISKVNREHRSSRSKKTGYPPRDRAHDNDVKDRAAFAEAESRSSGDGDDERPHGGDRLDDGADAEEHGEHGAPEHPRLRLLALVDVAQETAVPVPPPAQLRLDDVHAPSEELPQVW